MTPPSCPACKSDASMIETLKDGHYCKCCSHVFIVKPDGTVTIQTNHSPRKTDINGVAMIDGD